METDYLDRIEEYNIRRAWPVPGKTALLVIDMQEHFRPLAEPLAHTIVPLIDAFRAGGAGVLFTRHGHRDPAKDGGMLLTWWGELIHYGTAAWKLLPELGVVAGESIIDKDRYSAFFGTDLDDRLRADGVEDVVICGVLTNCCCETTARDAFMRDYRVFLMADASTASNEELPLATLKNLAYGFAYIVNTGELCGRFNEA